jgi:hypothetical protein
VVDVPLVPTLAVTPDPPNVTADAPASPVPEITAARVDPIAPASGLIAVMVGGGATVVKPLNGGDVPPVVVTETVRMPSAAIGLIDIMMGRVVDVAPVPILAVTPDPPNVITEAPANSEPEMTAMRFDPIAPTSGLMPVIVG